MTEYYISKFTGKQLDDLLTCVAEGRIQAAVCQKCGAPLNDKMTCEYCGTHYKYVLQQEATE